MDHGDSTEDVDPTEEVEPTGDVDRMSAAIATVPFLAIGAFNVLLVVLWGAEYLWGFLIVLPVCFVSALAWFAFRASP